MMGEKKAMMGEMEKKHIYGSESFIKELNKKYAISPLVKPVGRPKTTKEKDN